MDTLGPYISIAAALTAALALYLTLRRDRVQRGQHSLGSYRQGIDSILDLKARFIEHSDMFPDEPIDALLVPKGPFRDTREFLLYASAMWNLSFAWRVANDGDQLCISKDDRDALFGEVKLWLRELPKFQALFELHSTHHHAHSKPFTDWVTEQLGWEKAG